MRNVFFSFDYQDVWRANVVRNSWVTQGNSDAGFLDKSLWEESKTKGASAIKKLIDDGLEGTSVTVVLVGRRTAAREFVAYELAQSIRRGNGIVGVHIASISDKDGRKARKGANPLRKHTMAPQKGKERVSDVFATYDWVKDDGFRNLGRWVDDAAVRAGRPESVPTQAAGSNGATILAALALFGFVIWGATKLWTHLAGGNDKNDSSSGENPLQSGWPGKNSP